ncbi:MAG TPA: hypothetical protein VMC05_11050 [Xanthobacteraceae bacterium]|nr:hypothetical protein [Xanthobacteraceae bacterium]
MGWVHRHKRRGAYFALAALLLQIAISFGHVDLDGAVIGDHLALGGAHRIAVVAKTSQHPPAPNGDDGYCPICASIFLVSTSFVSTPPPLPVPEGFYRVTHAVRIVHGITTTLRVAFRSRAPPAA